MAFEKQSTQVEAASVRVLVTRLRQFIEDYVHKSAQKLRREEQKVTLQLYFIAHISLL
jgi:hypothetical protein